jgi:hypothetical protein
MKNASKTNQYPQLSAWSYKVIEIGNRIGSNNFNCPVTAHQNGLEMRKFGQCSISLSKMTEPRKVASRRKWLLLSTLI